MAIHTEYKVISGDITQFKSELNLHTSKTYQGGAWKPILLTSGPSASTGYTVTAILERSTGEV